MLKRGLMSKRLQEGISSWISGRLKKVATSNRSHSQNKRSKIPSPNTITVRQREWFESRSIIGKMKTYLRKRPRRGKRGNDF